MKWMVSIVLFFVCTSLRAYDEFRDLKGHTGPTRAAIYTPDGKKIVSCSGWPEGDATVRVWEVASGKLLHTMKGHTGNIDYLALSADGKTAYSASMDKTARIWDVETGKEKLVFKEHGEGGVSSIAISPDGKTVVSGDNKWMIFVWDAATGKVHHRVKAHENEVRCLAISPDGKTLYSGSWDGTVKVWDLATMKQTKGLKHETKRVENFVLFDKGKKLAVACDVVTLWDLETGGSIRTFEGHPGAISIGVSADGKKLVTGWYDGKMKLWNGETGELTAEFQAHEAYLHWMSFSPDGKFVATSGGGRFEDGKGVKGKDHVVRIWKLDE
jgi:WD40 repeat protein